MERGCSCVTKGEHLERPFQMPKWQWPSSLTLGGISGSKLQFWSWLGGRGREYFKPRDMLQNILVPAPPFPCSYISRLRCDLPIGIVVLSLSLCMPQNTLVREKPPHLCWGRWQAASPTCSAHVRSWCLEGRTERSWPHVIFPAAWTWTNNFSLAQSLIFVDLRGT